MILQKEIDLIKTEWIKEGVLHFITKYEGKIRTQPTSLSMKHHKQDPIVEQHLQRTVWFADELCREFNIIGERRDTVLAAAILHDIGNYDDTITLKGRIPGAVEYFPASDWSRMKNINLHPTIGQKLIEDYAKTIAPDVDARVWKPDELPVPFSPSAVWKKAVWTTIGNIVACHMSHWYNNCPQPYEIEDYIVCMADYLAAHDKVIIQGD